VDAAPSVKAGAEMGAARDDSAGISAAIVASGKDSSAALSAGSEGVFDKGNGAPAPVLAPAEKAGVQNEQIETASAIRTGDVSAMPVASMPEASVPETVAETKAAAPVDLPVAALSAVGVSQTPSAKLMARADTGRVAVSAPVDLDVPKVAEAEADLGTPYKVAKADISQKVALATAERTNLVLPQSGKAKIRDIVNANGGVVLWDGKTKTVTAYINNVKVEMTIGSRTIKVNGKSLTVNMIPKIQNGRTIIDVSDLKRAFDLARETN
ncbi:MAG: hypothetical protein J5758_03865, partial [Abditibacteriota bacterium]|nr:hypothetical protein [Abditibacteriota bacterium]